MRVFVCACLLCVYRILSLGVVKIAGSVDTEGHPIGFASVVKITRLPESRVYSSPMRLVCTFVYQLIAPCI